jgi:hypothetical protein
MTLFEEISDNMLTSFTGATGDDDAFTHNVWGIREGLRGIFEPERT